MARAAELHRSEPGSKCGASAEQGPLTFRATQPHRSGLMGGTAQGLLFIIGFQSFVSRRWPQQPRPISVTAIRGPVNKRTIADRPERSHQRRRMKMLPTSGDATASPSTLDDFNTRLLPGQNWQFLQPLLIISASQSSRYRNVAENRPNKLRPL